MSILYLSNKRKPAGVSLLRRRLQRLRALEGVEIYLAIVAAASLLLVIWMSFAHIDRVVRVGGKIIPAGRSQEIQHLEGGIVSAILVHEGQLVKKGDVLLQIEDTKAGADLGETTANLQAQEARAARLQAESTGADTISFPSDIAGTPIAAGEQALFVSRREKLRQETAVHRNAMEQQQARLAEASRRIGSLSSELEVASKRVGLMRDMASRQAASKLELLDAQSGEGNLQTQLGEARASIATSKSAIAEERSRMEGANAEFRSQAQSDLVATTAEITRLKQIKISATDRVRRTEIHAPADGIINHMQINTLGGVVRPGEALLELIPSTDAILIEAKALPKDRANLRAGLNANIRVSAYDVGELGTLKGKVTQVSADTLAEPNGSSYYRVNLLVEHVPDSYRDRELVPGMTATADIVTGNRTIMGMLLAPLRKFTYGMFRDGR